MKTYDGNHVDILHLFLAVSQLATRRIISATDGTFSVSYSNATNAAGPIVHVTTSKPLPSNATLIVPHDAADKDVIHVNYQPNNSNEWTEVLPDTATIEILQHDIRITTKEFCGWCATSCVVPFKVDMYAYLFKDTEESTNEIAMFDMFYCKYNTRSQIDRKHGI